MNPFKQLAEFWKRLTRPTYVVKQIGPNTFIIAWGDNGEPVPGEPGFATRYDAEEHIRALESRLP